MNDFLTFCRDLGIRIDSLPPVGVWKRYPTDDKPRKRNGAVKYFGSYGFVQNHALMTEPAVWQDCATEATIANAFMTGGQLLLTGDMTAEDVMASVQTAAAALK